MLSTPVNKNTKFSIVGLEDGGWVATWHDGADLIAQKFDASGLEAGAPTITDFTNLLYDGAPQISGLEGGGFVIFARQSGDAVFQVFDATGTAMGMPRELVPDEENIVTTSPVHIDVAAMPGGGFVVVWEEGGTRDGIFAQVFDDAGVPTGDPIEVNEYTIGTPRLPSVAVLDGGDFVVTWEGGDQSGQESEIYARTSSTDPAIQPMPESSFYNATEERQVNTYMDGAQDDAQVATLADGGYVVVWRSYGERDSHSDIYAQRYDANDQPIGEEFLVNSYVANNQWEPDVIGLTNGGFVMAWSGAGELDGGVHMQRFNADGTMAGDIIWVDDAYDDTGSDVSLSALANGDFIVSWQERTDASGNLDRAMVRLYSEDGTAQGAAIELPTPVGVNANSTAFDVAALNGGGWVAVWNDGTGLVNQLYSDNGTAIGASNAVDIGNLQSFGYPEVTALATGGFVVVARQSASDMTAQLLDAAGNAVGAPVELAADETLPTNATPQEIEVAGLPGGGFVAVWEEQGLRTGVFAQAVTANGQIIGEPILVNEYALGSPRNASVAVLTNGSFVVTWNSDHQSGQDTEVFSRTFTLDPDLFPVPEAEQQFTLIAEEFVFEAVSIQAQYDPMEFVLVQEVPKFENQIEESELRIGLDEPALAVLEQTFDF